MPMSRYQIERDPGASVITITPGNPPVLWFGREQVTEKELVYRLTERRQNSTTMPTVYIRSDGEIPAAYERRVAETGLLNGFRVYLLGKAFKPEKSE